EQRGDHIRRPPRGDRYNDRHGFVWVAGLRRLRARHQWPGRRTAAEKRDEFPPPHGTYPKAKDQGLSIAGSGSAFRGRASQQKRPAHIRFGSKAETLKTSTSRPLCLPKRTSRACLDMSVQWQQGHWSTLTLARPVARPSRLSPKSVSILLPATSSQPARFAETRRSGTASRDSAPPWLRPVSRSRAGSRGISMLQQTPLDANARSTEPPNSCGMRSRMMLTPYLQSGEAA